MSLKPFLFAAMTALLICSCQPSPTGEKKSAVVKEVAPRQIQDAFTDCKSGITFPNELANLNLTNAMISQFGRNRYQRFVTYSDSDGFNKGDESLYFHIEDNKFMQLDDLEKESWNRVKSHVKDLYRINYHGDSQDGYKYKYVKSGSIRKDWATYGEVFLQTGWQQFPVRKNHYPQGLRYNLHILVIKEGICYYVTYTRNKEVRLDDEIVDKVLALIEKKSK